jgi:protein O-GlcNAc transferase
MTTAEQLFTQGLRHFHEGRWPQAQQLFERTLIALPDHVPSLHLLGLIAIQTGQHQPAHDFFRRAVAGQPGNPDLHALLGTACHAIGQIDEALACYRRALQIAPRHGMALNNLGITLMARGHREEAIEAFQRALEVQPEDAGALTNLANALSGLGRADEAAELFRRAIRQCPTLAQPHNNLGNVLQSQGRFDEAEAAYREAIRLSPRFALAQANLGNLLATRGRNAEAVAAYRRCLSLRPDWSVPHYNLGLALRNQGRAAESRAALQATLFLAPDDPVFHSTYVGSFHYDPDVDGATLLAEHQRWAEQYTARLPPPEKYANVPDSDRRLRVGYVSPDFRSHASSFFLGPILVCHDPEVVETWCYAEVTAADVVTARFRAKAGHWCDTPGMTDDELAARIRADDIDVLVDLSGHMAHNRLLTFARRPAPVQVSYLGYPGTTGLPAIPYRLLDALTLSPSEPVAPGEELVLLPGLFCCYAPPQPVQIDPTPPSRREGCVTFGSLHKLDKLNDAGPRPVVLSAA